MKILHILTTKLSTDGITTCILTYYRNIDRNRFQMDVVAPATIESVKEQIESYNGKIHIIKDRIKRPIKYIKNLSKVIKSNGYDAVHIHGSSAILSLELIAAKKAGCKIRIIHSHNTKSDHKIIDKLLRPILYKNCTHRLACGEDAGKFLFGNRKFEIVNNGKNIEEFKYNKQIREEIRRKHNLSNKIVIGHVGAFNYQKNHEFLIDIFNELTKIDKEKYKLVLLGEGRLRKEMEEKAKQLNIYDKIIFVGRSNEVTKWLQAMDIMVFPSRFEGFPIVLVEWQIAGLPCIISDKITKKVSLTNLVDFMDIKKSPKEWAERISNIKMEDREEKNSEVLNQIREKGFDIKDVVKQLETLYTTMMEENKK